MSFLAAPLTPSRSSPLRSPIPSPRRQPMMMGPVAVLFDCYVSLSSTLHDSRRPSERSRLLLVPPRHNDVPKLVNSPVCPQRQQLELLFPSSLHAQPGSAMSTAIINPSEILAQLSTDEKAALLSGESLPNSYVVVLLLHSLLTFFIDIGDDLWHTVPIPRLGLPRVRVRVDPYRCVVWLLSANPALFLIGTGQRRPCE